MNLNPQPEYSEQLELNGAVPEKYIDSARRAAEHLGWQIASLSENEIMCQTPGDKSSLGECITIRRDGSALFFHSRSVDEIRWAENQNYNNARLFADAIATVIEQNREMERKVQAGAADILKALIPSKAYLVTPVLIYINVFVFLCMVVSGVSFINPETQSLLAWGGDFRGLTMSGQWWRLITSMFLHAGIIHLLMNMYALLYIGMYLEPLLGRVRYTAAYLLSGVCASLMSITMHEFSVGVGASGAIFGLFGVFLAMLTTKHIESSTRNALLKNISVFIVYNLLYGIKGNTDNAAHIGGLISGVIIGYAYFAGLARRDTLPQQAPVISILSAAVFVTAFITLVSLPNNLVVYEKKMKSFVEMESMALEVYNMNPSGPKEDMLYNIAERGIYYWDEDIQILNDLSKINLPDKFKEKNKKLIAYCQLRKKIYKLLYKKIDENTDAYDDELKADNEEISKMIDDLKDKDK